MLLERRSLAVCVALVLGLGAAPAAQAMPGDPPITSVAPADGAAVPPGSAPITVRYACPVYVSDAFGNRGGPADYDVSFSRSPTLGPDGRLADIALAVGEPVVGADGLCSSTLGSAGGADMPRQTGGRVYWQPKRSCTGCGGSSPYDELGAVRSFTVAPATVSASLTAPRLYAGYRQVFTLKTATAEFPGATVRLERRVGSAWTTIADEQFSATLTFVALLPRGRQRLRAVAVTGASRVVLATRTVTVARTGPRTTSSRDDGRYAQAGPGPTSQLELRVRGGGTSVSRFRATVTTECLQPDGTFTAMTTPTAVDRVRIAPDGSVVGVQRSAGGAERRLIGRVRNRRFKGTIFVTVGACVGTRAIDIAQR